MSETLLQVENLRTYFHTFRGVVKAVDGISFSLDEGQVLGIVGESGSGKSVSSFSILKLNSFPRRGHQQKERTGNDEDPRQGDLHGVPGSDDLPESALYH